MSEICVCCDVAFVHPGCYPFCLECYKVEEQMALEASADMALEDGNEEMREDNFRDDVEADADVLRSCGWGTDEDYGDYGMDYDFGRDG